MEKVYSAAKGKLIFTSNTFLSPNCNKLMSNKHKCFLVYKFIFCCSNSYICQTSWHLETRIKEHTLRCVRAQVCNQTKTISIAT